MYLDIIGLALLIGLIAGGKISNLGRLPLKGLGLFVLLGAVMFGVYFTRAPERQIWYQVLIILAMLVAMVLLLKNRHLPGIKLIFFGLILNFVVMAANGGRMPVSQWAAVVSGQADYLPELISGTSCRHVLLGPDTHLKFLADIIPLPSFYPVARVLSAGDLFIFAGIIRLTVWGMLAKHEGESFVNSIKKENM